MKFASARTVFWSLFAAVAVAFPAISGDFGITYDEYAHHEHGRSILRYFTGESDQAAKHPDSEGQLSEVFGDGEHRITAHMNAFGGFFDLTVHAAHEAVGRHLPIGEYEFRHLINSLYGMLVILFVGLFARDLGGWGAGSLAIALAALSPRIVGHSMNNPKDIPFAALYIVCLYLIHRIARTFPVVTWRIIVLLGVAVGIALDIRIGALLLLAYFAAMLLIEAVLYLRRAGMRSDALRRLALPAAAGVAVIALAYATSVAFWPFAHTHPFEAHGFALRFFARFESFNPLTLFEGGWIHRSETPWYYVPKWIWITVPLSVAAGVFLAPLAFTGRAVGGRATQNRHSLVLLAFATVFPLVYIVAARVNVYDEARHALFVLPPLIVLCALGWSSFLELLRPRAARYAGALAISAFLIEPAAWMVRNHPHEAFYFSPVVGGTRGAFKKYEMDYWGSSLRSAAEWITRTVPAGSADDPVRVRMWYGHPQSLGYFLEKRPGYRLVSAEEGSPAWDYSVVLPATAKYFPIMLRDWPPAGTVHQVMAGGAPLNAIVFNRLHVPGADTTPVGVLMNEGLVLLHSERDPVAAAALFRRVLIADPTHYGGHYQLAVALDQVGRRAEAEQHWETALRLAEMLGDDATFEIARSRRRGSQ